MIIGSVLENKNFERRIAITPDLAKKYISSGFEILIEKGFGVHLDISDNEFIKEGCKIEKREDILKIIIHHFLKYLIKIIILKQILKK